MIALALVLAIAAAVPAVATIPAADLGLVDLEDVSASLATSPLLPPAELAIALPPPAHGPPLASLEAAPDLHLRVALAAAVARLSACPQAENRIRGRAAVGSAQHQRNQWFRLGIAPGVCDGPNMYQGFINSPLNYGDPLGLYCLGFLGTENTKCTDWILYWEPGVYHRSRAELLKQHRDPSLSQGERNRAAMKSNAQIPGFFVEEGLRLLWNSVFHGTAADNDAVTAVEERFEKLAGHAPGSEFFGALDQLEAEGYDTSVLVRGGMPGPPSGRLARSLGRALPSTRGPKYFGGGPGAATRGEFFSHAWIQKDLYQKLRRLAGPQDVKKFEAALRKRLVGPEAQSGVKILRSPHLGYTHELKIGGSKSRLLGKIDEDNVLVFDKYLPGGLH